MPLGLAIFLGIVFGVTAVLTWIVSANAVDEINCRMRRMNDADRRWAAEYWRRRASGRG